MGLISTVTAEVDASVRDEATAVLAVRGLTVSDAIRIVLARVAVDESFANGLVSEPERPRLKSWDDFFDAPGIDFPDREPAVERERDAF